MIRRPPRSTLFPSPTLSRPDHPGYSCCLTCSRLGAVSGRIHRWRAPAYPPTVRVDPCHREARIRTCRAPGNEESEEHTSELQSPCNLVCRLLLEKKKPHIASHVAKESTGRDHRLTTTLGQAGGTLDRSARAVYRNSACAVHVSLQRTMRKIWCAV